MLWDKSIICNTRYDRNIIFLGALLFVFMLGCKRKHENEKFNKERWISGNTKERGNMAEDLVGNYELKGKSKSEIIELLGEPKDTSEFLIHYLVDYGYMAMFHLEFDSIEKKVSEVKVSD